MTNTGGALKRGTRVRVWTGQLGWVRYVTRDGWIGVRLDHEPLKRVDEYQAWMCTPVAIDIPVRP